MNKRKPFPEIETDTEYLRAVGMGPETCPELYNVLHKSGCGLMSLTNITASKRYFYAGKEISHLHLGLDDTDPARKWENYANALLVLGPEMDRRGWYLKTNNGASIRSVCYAWLFDAQCGIGWAMNDLPHIALLEAFYNAHAQGETA